MVRLGAGVEESRSSWLVRSRVLVCWLKQQEAHLPRFVLFFIVRKECPRVMKYRQALVREHVRPVTRQLFFFILTIRLSPPLPSYDYWHFKIS